MLEIIFITTLIYFDFVACFYCFMLLRLVLYSYQKYPILVICVAIMRQENMIVKNGNFLH